MKKLNLEYLSEYLHANLLEGLGGEVLAVESLEKGALEIDFVCDDREAPKKVRRFRITCLEVAKTTVCPAQSDEIALDTEHVVLWKYNLPHFQLFYRSVPKSAYETLGRLLETHDKALSATGCVSGFIDPANFIKYHSGGLGLLARGPEPQLEIYQDAILEQVDTYMIPSYEPKGGYAVLWFEVGHVIAQSFEIEEIFESTEE